MSTTPLPPPLCIDDHEARYSAEQMQAYAQQARADLEAENQRLREALRLAHDHIDMNALRISHCKDAEAISAALKGTP